MNCNEKETTSKEQDHYHLIYDESGTKEYKEKIKKRHLELLFYLISECVIIVIIWSILTYPPPKVDNFSRLILIMILILTSVAVFLFSKQLLSFYPLQITNNAFSITQRSFKELIQKNNLILFKDIIVVNWWLGKNMKGKTRKEIMIKYSDKSNNQKTIFLIEGENIFNPNIFLKILNEKNIIINYCKTGRLF